jgi:hypothetical protein
VVFTPEYNPLQSEAVHHTASVRLAVCQLALGLDITILKTVKCRPPLKSYCTHFGRFNGRDFKVFSISRS